MTTPTFGSETRKQYGFAEDVVPICQGSYGAFPNVIMEERISLLKEVASAPDHYYRRTLLPRWNNSLKQIADFLNLKFENTVFVDNATSGMNVALRSLEWSAGDKILVNSSTYPAVYQTCQYLVDRKGVLIEKVDLTPPLTSEEDVVQRYETALAKYSPIKLAIIDAISSPTATRFPLHKLVPLLKSHDILVAIDAAHAPGQIEVDVEALQPDFYTGNLHKWFYVPQTCAILWIHPRHHSNIVPNTVSTHYGKSLHLAFYWQGTSDFTQALCVPRAIQYYESIGGIAAINSYVISLMDEAVAYLTKLWGTREYDIAEELKAPNLRGVILPPLPNYPLPEVKTTFVDQIELMTYLYNQHKIMTMCLCLHGLSVVRLSGNVYNTMDDYKKLGEVILQLKNEKKSS